MMIIFLTVPAALLSLFLAILCYRKKFFRHAVVLSIFATFMLFVTLVVIVFGYSAWTEIENELALLYQFTGRC
jgi:hypothetical protein